MKRIIGDCLILALAAMPFLVSVQRAEAGVTPALDSIVPICYTGGKGFIGYVIYVPYYYALKAVYSGKASFTWGPPSFPLPKTQLEFCDIRAASGT